MFESLTPLIAVVLGGVLTIAGGYFSTYFLERQRVEREQKNLALAFRGEISAIMQLVQDRDYVQRFTDIIAEIEKTGVPFYAPFKVRRSYDSVFQANADKPGTLPNPLPELIAVFYARAASVLDDLASLGDGTYTSLSVPQLLGVYKSTLRMLQGAEASGKEIIATVDAMYGARK